MTHPANLTKRWLVRVAVVGTIASAAGAVVLCTLPSHAASELAPIKGAPKEIWTHAPYEAGACDTCHERADTKNPGKVVKKGRALCLECHEEFADSLDGRKHKHESVETCSNCHNPHNGYTHASLRHEHKKVCVHECHDDVPKEKKHAKRLPKAGPKSCSKCHDPHGSNRKKLLRTRK